MKRQTKRQTKSDDRTRQTQRVRLALLAAGLTLAFGGARGTHAQAGTAATQITEITVEHTPCFGTCPVYKVTLKRDGTATYVGSRFVDKIGTYAGHVYQFDHLARAIERRGYGGMKPSYSSLTTDLAHVITTVVRAGKRQTVDNYGDAGPQELWEIQTLIDGAVAEGRWVKVSGIMLYPPTRRF